MNESKAAAAQGERHMSCDRAYMELFEELKQQIVEMQRQMVVLQQQVIDDRREDIELLKSAGYQRPIATPAQPAPVVQLADWRRNRTA